MASYVVPRAGHRRLRRRSRSGPRSSSVASCPRAPPRLVALLLLVGTVLWSFPDLISGLLGQGGDIPGAVDRQRRARSRRSTRRLAVGRRAARARRPRLHRPRARGRCAAASEPGDDPWHGHTLEWATSSPPPVGNFASLPPITSEAPLYDARHQPRRPPPDGTATVAVSPLADAPPPPPRRPRVLFIGAAFGAAASALRRARRAGRLPPGARRRARRRAAPPSPTASCCPLTPGGMGMVTLAMSVVTIAWAV